MGRCVVLGYVVSWFLNSWCPREIRVLLTVLIHNPEVLFIHGTGALVLNSAMYDTMGGCAVTVHGDKWLHMAHFFEW